MAIISSIIFQDSPSCGDVMQNCSIFLNWCTRKMPSVSRPCEPTSWRKHSEMPAYRIGRIFSSIHSSRWNAAIGCSDVAIRYFSSIVVSVSSSLPCKGGGGVRIYLRVLGQIWPQSEQDRLFGEYATKKHTLPRTL